MDTHLTLTELESGLIAAGSSPQDRGTVEMIVARPAVDERRLLERAELDLVEGLTGDTWRVRPSKNTPDGSANPDAQITLMNSRVIHLLAQDRSRWALAGDQLYVDLDLSVENLPPGQRLAIGTAVLEVTAQPHTGCDKFMERFGPDATKFVNAFEGRHQRRRGMNARVVQPGTICVGDLITKIDTL